MFELHRSEARGRSNHGWLDSRHSFTFADHVDPRNMNFGPLCVINEDRIEAGTGFGTHGHRDMEIISYVLEGELAHKDSIGNGSVILPGDVQRMSAGTGVMHSEYNHTQDRQTHFLQIWISRTYEAFPPDMNRNTSRRRKNVDACDLSSVQTDRTVPSLCIRMRAFMRACLTATKPQAWRFRGGAVSICMSRAASSPLTASH